MGAKKSKLKILAVGFFASIVCSILNAVLRDVIKPSPLNSIVGFIGSGMLVLVGSFIFGLIITSMVEGAFFDKGNQGE